MRKRGSQGKGLAHGHTGPGSKLGVSSKLEGTCAQKQDVLRGTEPLGASPVTWDRQDAPGLRGLTEKRRCFAQINTQITKKANNPLKKDKGSEMTFLQRRRTNGPEAHEKILNIFSHHRCKSKEKCKSKERCKSKPQRNAPSHPLGWL